MREMPEKLERPPALSARARAQIPEALGPRPPANLARLTGSRAAAAHKFDKAFPVIIYSARGVSNGVGRNISAQGMFIETREPMPMGSEVRVVFGSKELGAEISALAEVRFQAFLNFAGSNGEQEGMRGMGVRFLRFEDREPTEAERANLQ